MKKREVAFNLKQSVNELVIPQYNALRDPFLDGYFANPQIKRNLRETGVIVKKRRFSLKPFRDILTQEGQRERNKSSSNKKRSKSQSK